MYIPWDKALVAIQLLLEGNSIRSTERISGLDKNTIMRVLVLAGAKCEEVSGEMIRNVSVNEIQADEIWSFIGKKEKIVRSGDDSTSGDAYCFVGIERNSKLVLGWHLGRRTTRDTEAFIEKINEATSGKFQITTDGFKAYVDAVHMSLATRVDFAQLVKVYRATPEGEPAILRLKSFQRRWSQSSASLTLTRFARPTSSATISLCGCRFAASPD